MQNQLVGIASTIVSAHAHTHTHTHISQIFCDGQLVLLGFPRCPTTSGVSHICVSNCVCMTRQRSIVVLLFMDVWWGWSTPKCVGCSLTEHNFFNLYIRIFFDQFLDSNLIDKHGRSNTLKFMEQYVSIIYKYFQE